MIILIRWNSRGWLIVSMWFFPSPLSSNNKRQYWSLSMACMWPLPLNMVACPLFLGCCFSSLPAGCSFHRGSHCSACTVQYVFSHQVTGVRVAVGVCLVWCSGGCSIFISMYSYVLLNVAGLSVLRVIVKFEYKHLHARVSWSAGFIMRSGDDDRY